MIKIDGRAIAQKIREDLKKKISALTNKPGLGVILVGADPASHLYVKLKEQVCAELGVHFEKFLFFATEKEEKIVNKIEELNKRKDIQGILVQLPLPFHLNTEKIIKTINPRKDVDGFHPENVRLLKEGKSRIEPVLIKTIWILIKEAIQQKNTVIIEQLSCLIIGNSDVFTEPLESFLRQKNLQTTSIQPQQLNKGEVKNFDIVIVAVGQPNFLNDRDIKDGAIVIDIGINRLPDGKIVGDVSWDDTDKIGWLTPVPGGVGPVTVAMLLENVYLLARKQI